MKYAHPILVGSLVCFLAGCGAQEPHTAIIAQPTAPAVNLAMNSPGLAGSNTTANANSAQAAAEARPQQDARKIIYNSSVNLNVESFDGVTEKVVELTETHGGFVASASLNGTSGNARQGSWTLRTLTEKYRDFLTSAGSLGEIVSKNEQTREVTAEYYDIEARIRNKQTEEQRLISILEERPGKLDDILQVEKEITRVRGEIEQMQGRLRVLQDLTSLSTITLTISEVQNYVPPEAPTFGTLVDREWQATWESLTSTGQWIVLTAISVGPWLLILALLLSPIVFVARRIIRTRIKQPAAG